MNTTGYLNRLYFLILLSVIIFLFSSTNVLCQTPIKDSQALQHILAKGWNTWDTYSEVSFTHMPEGITINLALKEYKNAGIMRNPLLYKAEQHITLAAHSDDGSYTDLELEWEKMKFRIQSATDNDNIVILVTPLGVKELKPPVLIAEAGIVWQLPGTVTKNKDLITWKSGRFSTSLFSTSLASNDPYLKLYAPYNVYALNGETGISTGKQYSLAVIKQILERNAAILQKKKQFYGDQSEIFNALQSSIAWNVVYDPLKKRVIVPVSRSWNEWHGGYVLFCWDNYFVSYMLSLYNKNLAYANAIAITNEITENGFVPNMSDAIIKTRDRSQPPIGSFCVREIYRKYREKWFLELLYDKLLTWNRWWTAKRDINGLLAWGSNSYKALNNNYWETPESGVGGWQGASFESGMDNAPMYVDIPFDSAKEVLKLWDVGLNSLYIMDCNALSEIARELGKTADYKELRARVTKYSSNLNKLWNEVLGIYCNRRTDNGEFSVRISPTCFYPMLTDVPDQKKIDRMMKEHFYNHDEFYGDWMLPSVPRNDTCFKEQNYWRGRVWAPLNFLVYLGLRKHNLVDAKNDLVTKSKKLLLKNWTDNHYVCENYNALTGVGAEKDTASDPFYHWGALLGFMDLIETGKVEAPEQPLN
ncbi:MAG TPA: trehalase family glycosidase [Chitinophagaceae bacterium]|nr:trehalase family glycosidase [Chitinophagaceae bacterium]